MDISAYIRKQAPTYGGPLNGMENMAKSTSISLAQLYRLRKGDAEPTLSVILKLGLKVIQPKRKATQ